jgi:hypothetical protein
MVASKREVRRAAAEAARWGRPWWWWAAVCAAAGLLVACSTTYQPQHSGRVAFAIDHAAAVYVKDGRVAPVGPFSGSLVEMVSETPAAAAHAHTAHRQFQIGIPSYLVGAGGVAVGVFLLSGPVGWVVIGTAVAAVGTGLSFMGAGLTHAVAKSVRDAYEKDRQIRCAGTMCTQMMSQDPSCAQQAVCRAGSCTLGDTPAR